jgi:hypothetical protein
MAGGLISAMCQGIPDRQDDLLDWATRHGRYVADPLRRARAYGALACVALDAYLPDTLHPAATAVRSAVEVWASDPSAENRAQVRRKVRRLYRSQHSKDGSWYAHRGIIDAAGIASPYPHNVRAVVKSPTWDSVTRAEFYARLWDLRDRFDSSQARTVLSLLIGEHELAHRHATDAQALQAELSTAFRTRQPVIGPQHADLASAMLTAYQRALSLPPPTFTDT